jgi:hypothetical protein
MDLKQLQTTFFVFATTVLKKQWRALTDLLPIVMVIAFFQLFVFRQPLPQFTEVIAGFF